MLTLKTNKGLVPITKRSNFNIIFDYEGEQTLSFDIFKQDVVYPSITERGILYFKDNEYKINKINRRKQKSTVTSTICLDDWKKDFFHNYRKTHALFSDILTDILPNGWIVEGDGAVTGRRTVELEGGNAYDILMSCKKTYNIVYEYHTKDKKIKIVKPDTFQSRGLYISDQLNLKELEYKGDSSTFATRLYAFGKKTEEKDDDGNITSVSYVNFASINDGKEYVDNNSYDSTIITAYWQDDRYTDPQSLLDDTIDKLKELSQPVRSYSITLIDLSRINDKYKFLDFKLYDKVTLLDSETNTHQLHQIVQYTEYPDDENLNKVSLSNVFKKITGTIDGIKQDISSIDINLKRSEVSINEIIRDVQSNTLKIENTYTKGEIDVKEATLIQQTKEYINSSVKEISTKVENLSPISTDTTYQLSDSGTDIPTGVWLINIPEPEKGKYLWTKKVVTYENGRTNTSYDISYFGTDGQDGTSVTVKNTSVMYATSDDITDIPTEWSNERPTDIDQGQYIWTKTTVTYSDGKSTTTYAWNYQGVDGSSVDISSQTVEYQVSDDGTKAPAGTWLSDIPQTAAGQYLWTRSITMYSNGLISTSYSVSYHGLNGEDAILLNIHSSNGNSFKNSLISTTLTVSIIVAGYTIDTSQKMYEYFGDQAKLKWKVKNMGETDYSYVQDDDKRLSDNGFIFTLNANDIKTKAVLDCELDF